MSVEIESSSRGASVSYSGSSSGNLDDYVENDIPPTSSRSRLGPVKTFSAALLSEYNGPSSKDEHRKELPSYHSEDHLNYSRGFVKSFSADVMPRGGTGRAPPRRRLEYSRSTNWDVFDREDPADFLPPSLSEGGMMRSMSYHESSRHHGGPRAFQRRTPPPLHPNHMPADFGPCEVLVIVENLPDEYRSGKDVRRLFLPFGNVESKIRVSSGVARVTFTNLRSAEESVKTLNGYPLSGKRLSVRFA